MCVGTLKNIYVLKICLCVWERFWSEKLSVCVLACVHVCVLSALESSRRSVHRYSTSGSAITNGIEPISCLGRVFNSKLGHSATLGSKCMVGMQPLLKLRTRPKACPVS